LEFVAAHVYAGNGFLQLASSVPVSGVLLKYLCRHSHRIVFLKSSGLFATPIQFRRIGSIS
jgi:hypothetical protein